MAKNIIQLLDAYGTDPDAPKRIKRIAKPKVDIPKKKKSLWKRLIGTDRRSYEIKYALEKALGR